MKCDKCGWIVADDTDFCDNCGHKIEKEIILNFCTSCGAEVKSGSTFCSVCGKTIMIDINQPASTSKQNPIPQTANQMPPIIPNTSLVGAEKPNARRVRKDLKKDNSMTIILVLIAVIILLMSIIIGYMIISNSLSTSSNNSSHTSSEKKEKSEEYVETEAPVGKTTKRSPPTPKPTPQSTEEPVSGVNRTTEIDSEGYATYVSRTNGFTCKYPAWFRIDDYTDSHFACSTDQGAVGFVVTCVTSKGESVEENMQNCISQVGGSVDYKMSGRNYFAVRLKLINQYYYRYSHFKDGKIYSFAVSFPLDELDEYDTMINYVYTPFREQF